MAFNITSMTNFLIALVAIYAALRLFVSARQSSLVAYKTCYILSFIFVAIGSINGGIFHGFSHAADLVWHNLIWKTAMALVGFSSFFMATACCLELESHKLKEGFISILLLQIAVYLAWIYEHNDFIYVIINYTLNMLLVFCIQTYLLIKYKNSTRIWMLSGVVVAFIAAFLQTRDIHLTNLLNHNDIYHIVAGISIYCIYRGVITDESTNHPA